MPGKRPPIEAVPASEPPLSYLEVKVRDSFRFILQCEHDEAESIAAFIEIRHQRLLAVAKPSFHLIQGGRA